MTAVADLLQWTNRPEAPEPTEPTGPEVCGACGQAFDTLAEVFSHPCPASRNPERTNRLDQAVAAMADPTLRAAGPRSNQYAGTCPCCNLAVPAGTGELRKVAGRWETRHHGAPDACPAVVGDRVVAVAPSPEPVAAPERTNKYAGPCCHCGGHVAAEAGALLHNQGNWVVAHIGTCPTPEPVMAPADHTYLAEHARPYAEAHGLQLHVVHRIARAGGRFPTVREHVLGPTRDLVIPLRMANGSPGNRKCTSDWKVKVVQRWCRDHGATPEQPATVAVGFSKDEWSRAGGRRQAPYERVVYPLLDLGLDREACKRVIADAGLPVPQKSACYFCPFKRPADFVRMAREEPELFAQACELEAAASTKRQQLLGKDAVYLTRFARPLAEVVAQAGEQLDLALYAEDEGYRCGDVCDT